MFCSVKLLYWKTNRSWKHTKLYVHKNNPLSLHKMTRPTESAFITHQTQIRFQNNPVPSRGEESARAQHSIDVTGGPPPQRNSDSSSSSSPDTASTHRDRFHLARARRLRRISRTMCTYIYIYAFTDRLLPPACGRIPRAARNRARWRTEAA